MLELVNVFFMPNYDIFSLFKNDNEELFIYNGNFKFFIDKQIAINAPGKDFIDINMWINGNIKPGRIEWENGVSLTDEYILEHSSRIY